jgi:hypothetical protein
MRVNGMSKGDGLPDEELTAMRDQVLDLPGNRP